MGQGKWGWWQARAGGSRWWWQAGVCGGWQGVGVGRCCRQVFRWGMGGRRWWWGQVGVVCVCVVVVQRAVGVWCVKGVCVVGTGIEGDREREGMGHRKAEEGSNKTVVRRAHRQACRKAAGQPVVNQVVPSCPCPVKTSPMSHQPILPCPSSCGCNKGRHMEGGRHGKNTAMQVMVGGGVA